jgi:hypothetical protein
MCRLALEFELTVERMSNAYSLFLSISLSPSQSYGVSARFWVMASPIFFLQFYFVPPTSNFIYVAASLHHSICCLPTCYVVFLLASSSKIHPKILFWMQLSSILITWPAHLRFLSESRLKGVYPYTAHTAHQCVWFCTLLVNGQVQIATRTLIEWNECPSVSSIPIITSLRVPVYHKFHQSPHSRNNNELRCFISLQDYLKFLSSKHPPPPQWVLWSVPTSCFLNGIPKHLTFTNIQSHQK